MALFFIELCNATREPLVLTSSPDPLQERNIEPAVPFPGSPRKPNHERSMMEMLER